METFVAQHRDHILILDEGLDSRAETIGAISKELPNAVIEAVQSVSELRSALETKNFDVVVLDQELSRLDPIQLLLELRMSEDEPYVLVVAPNFEPRFITEIHNNGGQRCIVKDSHWLPELGSSVRQALRYRKLQERNRDLHARLVATNIQLEEKNRRLDEFTATLAHDIRGPLGGLMMKFDFILEKWGASFDPRCETLVSTALSSLQRLNRVVQGMYEFAKLGSRAARMGVVQLDRLINETIGDMQFDESRQIQITLQNLPRVWGNEDLLRRVFINLLSNAVKYNDSSIVLITIGAAAQPAASPGDWCELFVADNGRGIPADEQKNIFGMFQRGSSAGMDADGMGVGLASVQRIIELHGGKIRVESSRTGTRFIFSLPLREVAGA